MKLITFKYNGKEQVGALSQDMKTVLPFTEFSSMQELIEKVSVAKLPEQKTGAPVLFENVELCAPIPHPKQDIVCLGINYMDHAKESAAFHKTDFTGERPLPVYFSKRVNETVASGATIPSHSDIAENLDYEVELGVILSKDASNVALEDVPDYVFGYTVINDISGRLRQHRHQQWYFGKSLDRSCPMGPWIVTADEIAFPPKVSVCSRVNGEVRQNSSTGLLIFDVSYIINDLTHGMTLKAGTIISTGTPGGVGMGYKPPRFLKSGDVVECEIENVGCLVSHIE
jgi:2-keto-4-pentenoate hydratase/2-oxohepta-3-ene-1,7-dioic acid hydratase in catechol pathway